MASGFIAINDLKVLCKNKFRFKTCKVTFRHDLKTFPPDKTFKLSELINYTLTMHKDEVICFADSVKVSTAVVKLKTKKEVVEEEYYEPIEVDTIFSNLNIEEVHEKKEEIELSFQKEKVSWVNRLCENEQIKLAIKLGYDCNDQYITERLTKEWPNFFVVDETTTYWKNSCPSMTSLKIEQRLTKQVNGYKETYGTFVRCCILQEHAGVKFDDKEAILIYSFFGKYEIIALASDLEQMYA